MFQQLAQTSFHHRKVCFIITKEHHRTFDSEIWCSVAGRKSISYCTVILCSIYCCCKHLLIPFNNTKYPIVIKFEVQILNRIELIILSFYRGKLQIDDSVSYKCIIRPSCITLGCEHCFPSVPDISIADSKKLLSGTQHSALCICIKTILAFSIYTPLHLMYFSSPLISLMYMVPMYHCSVSNWPFFHHFFTAFFFSWKKKQYKTLSLFFGDVRNWENVVQCMYACVK